MNKKIILSGGICWLLFTIVSGCGIKGDPRPPAEQQTLQAGQDSATQPVAEEKPAPVKKNKKKNEN